MKEKKDGNRANISSANPHIHMYSCFILDGGFSHDHAIAPFKFIRRISLRWERRGENDKEAMQPLGINVWNVNSKTTV